MAGSKQEGPQATIEGNALADGNRGDAPGDRSREGGGQPPQSQAEHLAELGRQGVIASAAAATRAAQHSRSTVASCAQEITASWARYAEEVMRHTSEASRALLRPRTFDEMLEVQAKLLRDTVQAFVDQSVKIAESASQMATLPWEA